MALIRGRDYVIPDDVADVAPDVLPHRLVLSYEAMADGLVPEAAVGEVLSAIPQPQVAPASQRSGEQAWSA
jgi:MoxR-like ATPase